MSGDVRARFGEHILQDDYVAKKRAEYDASGPYHHSVVHGLVNEDLPVSYTHLTLPTNREV